MRRRRPKTAAILGFLVASLCSTAAVSVAFDHFVPEPAKLEPMLRARTLERAAQLPRLQSLLVSIDGKIVEERYFNGARPTRPANLKSVSKSILSALVGIALDRGYLNSIHDTIDKFFTEELRGAEDPKKRIITLEDLLTMRSGLESTSNVNYGRWVQSNNWVRYALSRPLLEAPGERMTYSTGNSHLLSAVLTKATKRSTFEFARQFLAEPLGVPIAPWVRDPQGIFLGGNEMQWTARGMLAFGELYLQHGRARSGRQIISERWIKQSLQPRTTSRWSGRQYGYGWWIDRLAGHDVYYAWGHGGQFIFVLPGLKMVVVTTSVPSPGEGRREHQHAIYDLLEHDLIPAADPKRLTTNAPQEPAS